ncbi:hepcidin [Solea senegalensis]|uniref:Hepcidin n=3 Tax=Solea senegalensis TaxID=28829 RepID=B5BUY8_SOLSE|nr:hepcidin-1 [Solea senegalensis]KAG7474573.1 hepcidin [Solea senegalensis]BAG69595.1 hepcidin antimicrobial peptide 1 [Solea senegalensis]
MKAFSIAAAVTLVLAFVCFLEISAVPFTTVQELEEARGRDNTPAETHQETPVHSQMTLNHVRHRRWSHIHLCRWCRNCCDSDAWVYCCRTTKTSK